MKISKNKKGFTLVELLAVIVILALIMSIAIISMTGIMENARYSTYSDTARSIISGVRSQLLAANELKGGTQYYYFTEKVLENPGNLPFGGKIKFYTPQTADKEIGAGIYSTGTTAPSCTKNGNSFVKVEKNDTTGTYAFSICIGVSDAVAGSKYMNLTTETQLANASTSDLKTYILTVSNS